MLLWRPFGLLDWVTGEPGTSAPIVCLAIWLFAVLRLLAVLLREHQRYRHRVSRRAGFRGYLLYRFGHWYAWTDGASAILLCGLSGSLLVLGALLHHAAVSDSSLASSLWSCWIWIAAPDGGNSAQPGGEHVGIIVSVGGMLIFAMLISLVTAKLESTLWHLRHGSIPVVEGDHTVILGWTATAPTIIQELCTAMESRGGGYIVVLAPLPKPDVEQMFQDAEVNLRNSSVVVRSGQPHFKEDLARVAVPTSRRVLVLADTTVSHEAADTQSLNTLLTLNRVLEQSGGGAPPPSPRASSLRRSSRPGADGDHPYVVAECCLVRNQRLFHSLAYGRMEVLPLQDFVSQLAVECSRQRGLSTMISEMMSFDGDELYVTELAGLHGWRFEELRAACPQTVPLGFVEKENGTSIIRLAPPMHYEFSGDEQLIFLAEDKSTLPTSLPTRDGPKATTERRPSAGSGASPPRVRARGQAVEPAKPQQQLVVIIGWNDSVGSMLPELDDLLGQESEVIIYSSSPIPEREEFLAKSQKRRDYYYRNLLVTHAEGPLGARYRLEELPVERAGKIFILADSTEKSAQEADAHTVAAILQVRDILLERSSPEHLADLVIVPQILGQIAADACTFSGLTDYIDATRLSACVMASICESPAVYKVLRELLLYHGARIYVRRVADYARDIDELEDVELSFSEVSDLAAASGEVAIGYRNPDAVDCTGAWILNPKDKGAPIRLPAADLHLGVVAASSRRDWRHKSLRFNQMCQSKVRAAVSLMNVRGRSETTPARHLSPVGECSDDLLGARARSHSSMSLSLPFALPINRLSNGSLSSPEAYDGQQQQGEQDGGKRSEQRKELPPASSPESGASKKKQLATHPAEGQNSWTKQEKPEKLRSSFWCGTIKFGR